MADLEQQLAEDLALRNAARRLVKTDVENLKAGMAQKGLGRRVADRARDGAADIAENAADFAGNNKGEVGGIVALGIAALVGWIFRDRLADALYDLLQDNLLQDKGPLEETAQQAEQLAEDARSLID